VPEIRLIGGIALIENLLKSFRVMSRPRPFDGSLAGKGVFH
jgi:hypothetical protein